MYVEYVFLDNFFFDGGLLAFACLLARLPIKPWKLLLAAALGGLFAVVYPLVSLSAPLNALLKIAAGLLLPMLLQNRLASRKEWRKYARTVFYFLALSTALGGALIGVFGLKKLPKAVVYLGAGIILLVALITSRLVQKRAEIQRFRYPCKAYFQGKTITVDGFFDSGNRAVKNGLPVCFVSPDFLYDLFGWEYLETRGQVRDEMQISTISGEKTMRLYAAELEVKKGKERYQKRVYFSPTANMLTREYKILLNARVFEE